MPILTLRRRQRRNNALAFGLSLLLVLAVYALLGFAPFGDGTLLTGDLNGLYVNYITDMWRRVRQGGFFYSFAKLCGGSTLGLFAYYMNSPFNLLYLLFPVRAIPWVVQLVFALRTACTGAACCFFLQRHTGSAGRLLPFLSLGYSLCAFCVVYSQNILWMDVVMLAPLLLWAVEALAETGRHWPLTLLVFACTLFNFYTAWAVCLFSVLYFFWFWLRRPRAGVLLRRLGLFAGSGALGAGLALGLLLPALLEVEQSKGSLFALDFSLAPNYPLWQLPYRLFFGNFFWSDVTGTLPNLYCGTVTAALVLLFFTGARPRREKLAAGALLAALALCSWVRGLDLVWHGFKEPVWFPCRYSFLISLFLVLLAALALAGPPPSRRALAWAAALGAIWCAGYPGRTLRPASWRRRGPCCWARWPRRRCGAGAPGPGGRLRCCWPCCWPGTWGPTPCWPCASLKATPAAGLNSSTTRTPRPSPPSGRRTTGTAASKRTSAAPSTTRCCWGTGASATIPPPRPARPRNCWKASGM